MPICDKCHQPTLVLMTVVAGGNGEPRYVEEWCIKCAKVGPFDPENRDWDRVRDERDAEGDV